MRTAIAVLVVLAASCAPAGWDGQDVVWAKREADNQIERVMGYELNISAAGGDPAEYRAVRERAQEVAKKNPAEAARMCREILPAMRARFAELTE